MGHEPPPRIYRPYAKQSMPEAVAKLAASIEALADWMERVAVEIQAAREECERCHGRSSPS